MTIRVVLADDRPLVRTALTTVIPKAADLDVVGEAGTGAEAIQLALRDHLQSVLFGKACWR